ncbi:uncharacterized protein LOC114298037 isoform X2 [Camellia sinensis]|uniref:uncharacterized protein LOC114298037 isoform X2 n=1 Tax=Camellia sinensis TaxID=4442 RepID=UPI0010366F7D|nr:uncharacterized protein LOC114298037 isoform X2 [Camellia sinensis]
MRFVISVLLFLVFILFGVPFVLYSTRQVLLIAPAQIKRTKYYLLASFVLHIKHSESKDSAVSPRILLSGPAGVTAVMSRSYKHCREVLEYLNWISGRIPQKIMSMFFMEGNGAHLQMAVNSNMGILKPPSYTLGLYLYVTLYMMVSRTFFTNVQLPVCVYPRS